MGTKVTVLHDNNVFTFFNHLESCQETTSLCREVKAYTAPDADVRERTREMIQRITDRVYEKAQRWGAKVPTEPVNYQWLSIDLIETQKANFVYHNLVKNFQGTADVGEFQQSKYMNAQEMYKFFVSKGLLVISEIIFKGISDIATLDKCKLERRTVVSYQNCRLSSVTHIGESVYRQIESSVKELDLSHNPISEIGLRDSVVSSLDLSFNNFSAWRIELPHSIRELSLRGNSLEELGSFEYLDKLKKLDIAYMPRLKITEDFWSKTPDGLKIVISPDMAITVPSEYRKTVTFVSALDETTPLQLDDNGKVFCPRGASSSNGRPLNRDSTSKREEKSQPNLWKWLGIGAVLSALGYLIYRMWPRARA